MPSTPLFRAVSVQQPWAWAIASSGKDVENRTKSTPHRGLIAVHAPQHIRRDDIEVLRQAGFKVPNDLTVSAVVAVAELANVHSADDCGGACSPWAEPGPGVWHWRLTNTTPIDPIRVPGKRNLWTLPADVNQAVTAAVKQAGEVGR